MNAFLALVAFEIRERRALIAAAAVASLLPLLAPLLPSTGSNPASDIREAVMWVILGSLVPIFALLLGVSFIGRDISEGRMGFWYAQPLSGPTLWFGKLTAVVVLIWAVEIIIMLPTVLMSPDPLHFLVAANVIEPFIPKWFAPLVIWIASAVVILLAHAVGILWRARSAWLVLDLIALLLVVGGGWVALRPFILFVAPDVGIAGLNWLAGSVMFGLFAGGAFQVSCGRVDLGRGHRVLSTTLWTVLGVATIAVLGWSSWIRSATLEDVKSIYHLSLGSGDWIAVDAVSDGRLDYYPRFLFNAADGRSVSIGPATNWHGPELVFSGDGSRAVWHEFSALDHWPLMYADLNVPDPKPSFTGVVLRRDWDYYSVSPDGSRVVALENRTVAVYQIDPPVQLMAATIDETLNPFQLQFDDLNTVRILTSSRWSGSGTGTRWHLFFVDVAERRLAEGVEVDMPWRWRTRTAHGKADHNVVRVEIDGEDHLVIVGQETGEILTDLGSKLYPSDIRILEDGRIVVIRDWGNDHQLEIYSAEGAILRQVGLPEAEEIYDGGLVSEKHLLIGLWTWDGEIPNRTPKLQTNLIDLDSGESETILSGYAPVLGTWRAWSSRGSWAVGSLASRLLRDGEGFIHLWDSETNELTQIIPMPD